MVLKVMYYQPVEKYVGKSRDYTKQRNFVSCKGKYNYLNYVDTGSTDKIAKDYFEYVGNNEKSSGVFNENGCLNKDQKQELKNQLQTTESNIWDMLISFKTDFGNEFCRDYEQAHRFLKSELPKFFERVGLHEYNIVWYAGLHDNTDNKHLHISFFEKEPRYYSKGGKLTYKNGKISLKEIEKSKMIFEKKLSNASSKIVAARKEILDSYKSYLSNYDMGKAINKKLVSLYKRMPTDGRVSYDSENMRNLKPVVDDITTFILKNGKATSESFNNYMSELDKLKDWKKKRYSENEDMYLKDLFRRLGNQTIQKAIKVGRVNKQKEEVNLKGRRWHAYKKKMQSKEFDYCLSLLNYYHDTYGKEFNDFLRRLDKYDYERRLAESDIYM
ncbi:MAG: relaxase MobL [Clostridia bacterium]|nr:relaxase MobL [Clostridia bacterium]